MRKPNTFFQFKKFIVHQEMCAMKVGTDGVLLGAWTKIRQNELILDIGTGTGLIALMLAQKDESLLIKAIDIDIEAAKQALQNVARSPFSHQIEVEHISLDQLIDADKYDRIVSNPPFFIKSLKSPNKQRSMARHTESLPMEQLFQKSYRLLKNGGNLSLIYPFDNVDVVEHLAQKNGFTVSRKTLVYPKINSEAKRVLWEFEKGGINNNVQTNELFIESERHVYTNEFKQLVDDYYL